MRKLHKAHQALNTMSGKHQDLVTVAPAITGPDKAKEAEMGARSPRVPMSRVDLR